MKNSHLEARVVHSKRAKEGTIKVAVQNIKTNTKYKKQYKTFKYYLVQYDEKVELAVGIKVKIISCPPISKRKRFRITEVEHVTERK